MNCAIIRRSLFLIVLHVFSIYSEDSEMNVLGVRTFLFFTGYTKNADTNIGNRRCCLSTCVRSEYTLSMEYEITNNFKYSNFKHKTLINVLNQDRIYSKVSVDYPPEPISKFRNIIFNGRIFCKENRILQDEWHIKDFEYYPYNGSFIFKRPGLNDIVFIAFAIKGNCPGRAGKRCEKVCFEDNEKYCDEFTGNFYCKNRRFGENCEFQNAACNRNPCFKGICENVGASFRCHCYDGFSGETCKDTTCTESNCKNGLCLNNKFCKCSDGYFGEECETLAPSLTYCNGRGYTKISEDQSNYMCVCYDDAAGLNCEYSCGGICQNGGKCVARRNTGYCQCASSFIGKNCELKEGLGVCSTINCQNGGTCKKVGEQDFKCECTNLWYGSYCQKSVCSTDYCYHGNCIDNIGCVCYDGYSGIHCEYLNIQTYSECENEGKKTIGLGFLRCECDPKLTTGSFCEYTCSKRCINGLCQLSNSIVKCVCDAGYSGDDCSIKNDQNVCAKGYCLNGGECKKYLDDSFKCTCNTHWTGNLCEISTCQSNLCFKGTCVDGVGCVCFKGYKGKFCNEPVCPLDGSLCSKSEQCSITGSRVSCNCDRQRYYGQKCENECQPTCSENGVCGLLNGELKCICFANYKGERCHELIVNPAYLHAIYGCAAAIVVLVISCAVLIYLTMKHKLHFTAQAVKNALFDASNALGFKRTHKTLQVDDTYGAALQKGWAISSR